MSGHDEITGPSSDPQLPMIVTGTVAAPVIRTGLQAISGEFIVQGIDAFDLYAFTDSQRAWTVIALTILLSFAQNQIERLNGRRLIGAAS